MTRTPFFAFAVASTLATVGTRVSSIAIPWLVLTSTGSAVMTGVVALAELLPFVVAQALSGPLIDRLGAQRIAVSSDVASAAVLAIVPALAMSGWLPFEVLLPVVVLLGLLRGPSTAAKQAMVPAIAHSAGLPLERVTGVAGLIDRLSLTLGAMAAGGLIALVGSGLALLVNALGFALAAIVVGVWIRSEAIEPGDAPERPGYLLELREGFDFVRRDSVLLGIGVMVAVTNLFDQAFGAVMLPVWVNDHGLGPATLGLLFATMTGASVAGAALATTFAERLPRLIVYTAAFVVTGLPRFLVFALDWPIPLALGIMAVAGFASGFLNPILGAVIFERIPRPLMGRVSALTNALAWTLMPFGGLLGGTLIAGWGVGAAFLLCGVGYLLATLLPLVWPSFRQFDRRIPAGE